MDMHALLTQANTLTHYAVCKPSTDGMVWYDFHYGIWSHYPMQRHTLNYYAADAVQVAHEGAQIISIETTGNATLYR